MDRAATTLWAGTSFSPQTFIPSCIHALSGLQLDGSFRLCAQMLATSVLSLTDYASIWKQSSAGATAGHRPCRGQGAEESFLPAEMGTQHGLSCSPFLHEVGSKLTSSRAHLGGRALSDQLCEPSSLTVSKKFASQDPTTLMPGARTASENCFRQCWFPGDSSFQLPPSLSSPHSWTDSSSSPLVAKARL